MNKINKMNKNNKKLNNYYIQKIIKQKANMNLYIIKIFNQKKIYFFNKARFYY